MSKVELGTTRLSPQSQPTEQAPAPKQARSDPFTPEECEQVKTKVIDVLHTCFDPELPVNIYELGLIYSVNVDPTGAVKIQMTLTSPGCPVAGTLPREVEYKVNRLPEVYSTQVDLVWEPMWDKSRMSEAAKLQLGIDDY